MRYYQALLFVMTIIAAPHRPMFQVDDNTVTPTGSSFQIDNNDYSSPTSLSNNQFFVPNDLDPSDPNDHMSSLDHQETQAHFEFNDENTAAFFRNLTFKYSIDVNGIIQANSRNYNGATIDEAIVISYEKINRYCTLDHQKVQKHKKIHLGIEMAHFMVDPATVLAPLTFGASCILLPTGFAIGYFASKWFGDIREKHCRKHIQWFTAMLIEKCKRVPSVIN